MGRCFLCFFFRFISLRGFFLSRERILIEQHLSHRFLPDCFRLLWFPVRVDTFNFFISNQTLVFNSFSVFIICGCLRSSSSLYSFFRLPIPLHFGSLYAQRARLSLELWLGRGLRRIRCLSLGLWRLFLLRCDSVCLSFLFLDWHGRLIFRGHTKARLVDVF